MIKSTIENNIFRAKVITPLISISEQQIKNTFFNRNIGNKTFSFRYQLVSFRLPKKILAKAHEKKEIRNILKKFQATGVLPHKYKDIEINNLGNITEDGLTKDLVSLLKTHQ